VGTGLCPVQRSEAPQPLTAPRPLLPTISVFAHT
jgi:hypothetical protein